MESTSVREYRASLSDEYMARQLKGGYLAVIEEEWNEFVEDYVHRVIAQSDKLLVYLNEKFMPEHSDCFEDSEYAPEYGMIMNRVQELLSLPTSAFCEEQLISFRTLIAEGIARILDDKDAAAANEVLNHAEKFFIRCSSERSRLWQLAGAIPSTAFFLVILLCVGLTRQTIYDLWGRDTALVLIGICVGAVGAFASLALRLGNANLDHTSGRTLHTTEACLRIAIGAVTGGLVALALRAGVFFSFNGPHQDDATGFAFLALVCTLAGASERLLREMVGTVEARGKRSSLHPAGSTDDSAND